MHAEKEAEHRAAAEQSDHNRREFFRLSLLQDAAYRWVAKHRILTDPLPCILIDISAGGARIATKTPLTLPHPLPDGVDPADVRVEVDVLLLQPWQLRATIVWEDLQPIEKLHRYGLAWDLVHPRQRDLLLRELMRLEIRKKKGV
ncbi:hypothetical protein GCM10010885_13950 [Alicyclobacillus cellulosilyticus]|uniref:PilZ domain-containing protein n=1 Tax=Alicyclobacillus cellulosilyticus TaxID=1003997 RepID=A0A917NJH7_9BACL|nr:PilZ domain-containing protein [Alicyclobacillus cellulosilyticus]GGJ05968.1 hypothetical protein GCM10010885_13950 [Alicyclobacillus cellulosilyticus]